MAHIDKISAIALLPAPTREETVEATDKDKQLQLVRKHLRGEPLTDEELTLTKPFATGEMSVTDDELVLREHRLVVPAGLQQRVLRIAHEGHFWFLGMDAKVQGLKRLHPERQDTRARATAADGDAE